MTADKAREILELNINEAGKKMPPDVKHALTIAVGAIERIQVGRNNPGTYWNDLLPGETID